MRLFLAVDLPVSHRRSVQEVQRRLRLRGATGVHWVRPENLHWTVRFLGELPTERCGDICRQMRDLCTGLTPFDVSLGTLGAFPRWVDARVVFLEMAAGREDFSRLSRQVEAGLSPLGLTASTSHPHLTLGRVRRGSLPEPVEIPETVPFRIGHIALFESTLTPAGPWYRVVERFPLVGGVAPAAAGENGGMTVDCTNVPRS